MRLVLDTDVLVAALRSDQGASRRLLTLGLRRRLALLVSVPLVIEYQSVLTRPQHLDAAGLSILEVEGILDAVVKVAEPVQLAFLWRPALRDPDDDMVLETAVNGRADILVTFNIKDFGKVGERFGLSILRPGEALKLLEAE